MIPRETKPPRDYEVMDLVLRRGDAVKLARLLSVSQQLVRAWCRAPETEEEFTTGKFGPLARLRTVVHLVGRAGLAAGAVVRRGVCAAALGLGLPGQ